MTTDTDLDCILLTLAESHGIDLEELRRRPPIVEQDYSADAVAAAHRHLVATLQVAGVGERHAEILAAGAVRDTEALTQVRRLRERERLAAWIHGPHGVGKTLAVSWLALRAPSSSLVISASHLVRRGLWARSAPDPVTRITADRLFTAACLVIDDAGQEQVSDAEATAQGIDELLEARTRAGRETVITSNHTSVEDVNAYLGARAKRIRERLLEYGGIVRVGGESQRLIDRRKA